MTKILNYLRKIPLLNKLLEPETFGQFIRYFIVGISCFTIEYTLFIVLRAVFDISELLINVIVYTLIFWLVFLLNKFFSFKSKDNFKRQLFLFTILYFINLIIGNIVLFTGIRYLLVMLTYEGSWPVLYLPKILIMFFITSWNFILYKKVIYK